jgi:membrane protease YdiL (CAAX protease family)
VTDTKPGRAFVIDPDRWRAPADGPRWLYAAPGQLRAPWRLAAFALAFAVVQPIIESLVAPLFGAISRAVGEPVAAYPWIMLASVTAACVLALRVIDQAPWRTAGLDRESWRWRRLSMGFALGTAAILLTSLLLWMTGALRIEPVPVLVDAVPSSNAWGLTALRVTMLLAPSALWEELLFRGYLWTVAVDAGGIRTARWATAIAFGLLHVLNPGASLFSILLVTIAGFCLGAVRERTGSLSAAWAAHLAWNWVMAVVLHAPVSGAAFDTPGYRTQVSGATWWTGGTWGPEGGGAALLVMSGALLLSMHRQTWTQFRPRSGSR